jgi:hypothetical protein
VRLTQAGTALLPMVRRLFTSLDEATAYLQDLRGPLSLTSRSRRPHYQYRDSALGDLRGCERVNASKAIGTAAAAKSAPDGYTLLLVPTSHVINPSIYAKLPYDTEKDFAPITMVASAAILMAVHPNVKALTPIYDPCSCSRPRRLLGSSNGTFQMS